MLIDWNKSELGKNSTTPEKYSAALLFRIPRSENREKYGISAERLPFSGVDVWNCYEISFLTYNGLPISGMIKIIYPCESDFIVESKSLKLYLNSFNMEKMGAVYIDAVSRFVSMVQKDLENILETKVTVRFFADQSVADIPFQDLQSVNLVDLIPEALLYTTSFEKYNESPEILTGTKTSQIQHYAFRTNLMRSNCRVTNQPDWGDLFFRIQSYYKIDMISVVAYLVSFRRENHFHEEVTEMIYKRFSEIFETEKLMVAAMYTRRGGIDINPLRVSHSDWLDNAFISPGVRIEKTLRQ